MKYILLTALLTFSFSAFANTADDVCSINGTKIKFDLGSNSPYTEGSRFFEGIDFYFDGNINRPQSDLSIAEYQTKYVVSYADGVLDDGANYFMVRIVDPVSDKSFYAFYNEKGKERPAYSTVISDLPGVIVPESANATMSCD